MKKIEIKLHDVTLREWDQAPLTSFNKKEKQIIALMLNELWVSMEVWFWASRADYENIIGVTQSFENPKPYIASLWRAIESDTKASLNVLNDYDKPWIHLFIATPDVHINSKFEKKWKSLNERREWVLNQINTEVSRVKHFKNNTNRNTIIEFSPEAASDNAIDKQKILDFKSEEFDYLIKSIIIAIESWADTINIPDTVWNLLSHETEELFKEISLKTNFLKEKWYNYKFSCHIHNDLALASANAISAIRWWAEQIELTIAWIWERAWNTSLSDIIWIITEKWKSIMYGTNKQWYDVTIPWVNTKLIWPITRFTEKILSLNKSLHTPFVWWLCDKDWSWVHNASQEVYWWSKDKNKFWWQQIEEFFSPRWWVNQVLSFLKIFNINESKNSEIIQNITKKACQKAEETKALYACNILAMYLEEKWDFEIIEININWNNTNIKIQLNWKIINLIWIAEWSNWIISSTINSINKYIKKEWFVEVKNIKTINKPCLWEVIDEFVNEVNNLWVKLSDNFLNKINEIAPIWSSTNSKQVWVIHINLIIWWKEINSVSAWHNVDHETIKTIIIWSLSELI